MTEKESLNIGEKDELYEMIMGNKELVAKLLFKKRVKSPYPAIKLNSKISPISKEENEYELHSQDELGIKEGLPICLNCNSSDVIPKYFMNEYEVFKTWEFVAIICNKCEMQYMPKKHYEIFKEMGY